MSAEAIYEKLIAAQQSFEQLPDGPHLFCPKTDDEDLEDYNHPDEPGETISVEEKKKRIAAFRERALVVIRFAPILAIQKQQASQWLPEFTQRVESYLLKCDQCIYNWHMLRKPLVEHLKEEYNDQMIILINNAIYKFDDQRISAGLHRAKDILDAQGPMNASKLAAVDLTATLALYEALCCISYTGFPENRHVFNQVFDQVQQRKTLRMGHGIIPSMTHFLFHLEFPTRVKFAQLAWKGVPPGSMTTEQYDWAVNDILKGYIEDIATEGKTVKQIKHFWEAMPVILDPMGEDIVLHSLRGMQIQTDIYNVALQHLSHTSDDVLASVIIAITALLQKSANAFWDALAPISPSIVAQQVFGSPAFKALLAKSLSPEMMVPDGPAQTPLLVAWAKTFMISLPNNRRYEACETFLGQLLDVHLGSPHTTAEGQLICMITGMTALQVTLDGWHSSQMNLTQQHILVSETLGLVIKYSKIISKAAEMPAGEAVTFGLPNIATSIIQLAVSLDAKATRQEWRDMHADRPIPQGFERRSSQLWDDFLDVVAPGRIDIAIAMLMATQPLSAIEKFRPPKRETLKDKRLRFNVNFSKLAEAIGRMFERLGAFSLTDLNKLCANVQVPSMEPIVAALVHSEDPIRENAASLIKSITDQYQRSEAVTAMLDMHLETFLPSFTHAVENIIKGVNKPWTPMPHVVILSLDVLNGLCDTTVGVLRSRNLSNDGRQAVSQWWAIQWRSIQYLFAQTREWSKDVERKTLENFCRDSIELASKLLDQDGLFASALGDLSKPGNLDTSNKDAKDAAMKQILEAVRGNSDGLVDMIHLRDEYLIDIVVQILGKLLRRLAEFGLKLPGRPLAIIQNACTRGQDGKYLRNTNLTEAQRAELLRALGEDGEITVLEVQSQTLDKSKDKPKKQSKLDAWSNSASSPSSSAVPHRSRRDDQLDVTPTLDKNRALIDSFKSRPTAKPVQTGQIANISAFKEARQKQKAEMAQRKAEVVARAKALRAPVKTVPGEGSGLQGIAGVVHGKEHGPHKSELMVDSSSEEEDSNSDDDLSAMVAKNSSGLKGMDDVERRRQLELLKKMPVKKTKIQRSAKDMRSRLIPPMEVLHQAILEWDIFHEGNDPPNGYKCLAVANTYGDPSQYKSTFFPLLVNEAWRSFVTAKDENTSKPLGIKVLNRMSVDKFFEVTTVMPVAANKDRNLSEGDIVLWSKAENPLNDRTAPHCLARIWKTTYKKENLEVSYRLSGKNNPILQVLLPGAEFFAIKITNMTTIEREYAALESLQYYDLMDEILKAEPSPKLEFGEAKVESVMQNYQLNPGQAKAILNAKENDGFTLVQGPPGTGKTKTIVAVVGALLTGALANKQAGSVAISRPGGGGQTNGQTLAKKLLVCAPSNAAVDELVLRLKAGVKTMGGSFHKINVLRLGRSDAINAGVKDVTLDELVKARMDAEINKNGNVNERDQMHKEAGEIKMQLADLRPKLEDARGGDDHAAYNQLQREFDNLKRRQAQLGAKIDANKDSGMTFARENEIKRRQIQQKILDEAQVLCATLSGSGHEMFKNLNVEFETVIIDEAAQCVELSALIPLKYGCSKCILVGDPKQLPPTVLSQSAARFGYDQSLFVRMQRNHPDGVHLLDTQYRMHPEISLFPSQEFYERRLIDGGDMLKLRTQPWHQSKLLGPYRFFDVEGVQERGHRGQSLVNTNEVEVALQLYQRFSTDYAKCDSRGKIGIITPYKAQLFALKQRFTDKYGQGITDDIEFNTTDAFQGRECEIIIFSCVRASSTGGIGFMTDIRRMNVGLTRAKSSLWILGDSRALVQGEFWAKLIQDSKARDRYTNGNILALLRRSDVRAPMASATPGNSNGSSSNSSRVPSPRRVDEDVIMGGTEVATAPNPRPAAPKPAPKPASKPSSATPNRSEPLPPRRSLPPASHSNSLSSGDSAPQGSTDPPRQYVPSFGGLDGNGNIINMIPTGYKPPILSSTEEFERKRRRASNDGPNRPSKKSSAPPNDAPKGPKGWKEEKPTDPTALMLQKLDAQTKTEYDMPPPAGRLVDRVIPTTKVSPDNQGNQGNQGNPGNQAKRNPPPPPNGSKPPMPRKKGPANPFVPRKSNTKR